MCVEIAPGHALEPATPDSQGSQPGSGFSIIFWERIEEAVQQRTKDSERLSALLAFRRRRFLMASRRTLPGPAPDFGWNPGRQNETSQGEAEAGVLWHGTSMDNGTWTPVSLKLRPTSIGFEMEGTAHSGSSLNSNPTLWQGRLGQGGLPAVAYRQVKRSRTRPTIPQRTAGHVQGTVCHRNGRSLDEACGSVA